MMPVRSWGDLRIQAHAIAARHFPQITPAVTVRSVSNPTVTTSRYGPTSGIGHSVGKTFNPSNGLSVYNCRVCRIHRNFSGYLGYRGCVDHARLVACTLATTLPMMHGSSSGAPSARKKTARRGLIDTATDKRCVRRAREDSSKHLMTFGKSLTQDRRKKAKAKIKSGQGDKGDR